MLSSLKRTELGSTYGRTERHEVTRVLAEMSKMAREQLEGEPVVDYDNELATLYTSDHPYFAYWLRWGPRDLSAPLSTQPQDLDLDDSRRWRGVLS